MSVPWGMLMLILYFQQSQVPSFIPSANDPSSIDRPLSNIGNETPHAPLLRAKFAAISVCFLSNSAPSLPDVRSFIRLVSYAVVPHPGSRNAETHSSICGRRGAVAVAGWLSPEDVRQTRSFNCPYVRPPSRREDLRA